MEISNRLKNIASCVPTGTKVVADIGTDHGYIPIYLIKNKMAKRCIACDINQQPLNNAKNNILNYKMEKQIETRLSNGLQKIKTGEANAIIIAGMGGMLIIDILKESLDVVKAAGLLILQPQLDIVEVRKYIHEIEFTIVEETMVYEDDQYYTIITAKAGYEEPYSELEYLFGKKILETKSSVFKDFLTYRINQMEKIKENISNIKTKQVEKRLDEIQVEQSIYKEVYRCLPK